MRGTRSLKASTLAAYLMLSAGGHFAYAQSAAPPPPWDTGNTNNTPAATASGSTSEPGTGSQPGLPPDNTTTAPAGTEANPIHAGSLLAVPPRMNQGTPSSASTQPTLNGGQAATGASADPSTPTPPLGLMQQAWEAPNEHLGQGQAAPGLKIIDWTPGSTNVITIREDMLTNIVFPPGETILYRLLSDDSSYEAVIAPDHHSVSIRPIYIGVDADLNIYGASGNLYTFYLRSVPWDSPTLADVNVTVSVPSMGSILSPQNASDPDGTGTSDDGSNDPSAGTSNDPDGSYDSNNAIDGSAYDEDPSARLTLAPRADATKAGVDYAAQALTGNGRIRTDLQILAPSPTDAVIAPIAAWRDDRFTYLDFGPRAASMNEWPVASLVIDNTESPVGTRVAGPNRSIMVIEGIGNISLRDGDHIVCIKANFQNGDPRAPVEDEPYQNNRNSFSTTTNIQQSVAPPPGVTGPSSGDYSGDLQNGAQQPTWPGPSGTQVAAPFKIESGPYTVDIADMLADQIGRGYHDNQPAGANVVTTPPSQVGPEPYPDGIDGATAMVEITAASPVLANQLCQTLQKYDHTCRLY